VQAKKAVGQDSALEVGAKLAFHEVRNGMLAVLGACEKCLEVLTHRLMQQGFFRAARSVLGGRCPMVRGLKNVCTSRFRHPA
jgi:hypothetical protein